MKTEDIIKYAVIGIGAYLVWEYVIGPLLTNTGTSVNPGTGSTTAVATNTGAGTNTSNTVTGVPAPASVIQQNGAPPPPPKTAPADLAGMLSGLAGNQTLNVDQWSWYYAQLPGRTAIPPATFDTMLSNAGITAANRSNPMTVDYFVGMLNNVGLSGVGDIVTGLPPAGMGAIPGRGGFTRRKPNGFGGNNSRTSYVH